MPRHPYLRAREGSQAKPKTSQRADGGNAKPKREPGRRSRTFQALSEGKMWVPAYVVEF